MNATKQHVKRTSSEYSLTDTSKYCPRNTSLSIVLWERENNILLTVVPLTNRSRTTTPSRLCSNIESDSLESLKARLSASSMEVPFLSGTTVDGVCFDGNERQSKNNIHNIKDQIIRDAPQSDYIVRHGSGVLNILLTYVCSAGAA